MFKNYCMQKEIEKSNLVTLLGMEFSAFLKTKISQSRWHTRTKNGVVDFLNVLSKIFNFYISILNYYCCPNDINRIIIKLIINTNFLHVFFTQNF